MKSRGANKSGKLSIHFSSESHKEAVQAYLRFKDPFHHIDAIVDKAARKAKIQREKENIENKENMKILFDVAKTLAQQDIAFRGDGIEDSGNYRQIVALVARYCPACQNWLNSREKRKGKVTDLSPESQNEMRYDYH